MRRLLSVALFFFFAPVLVSGCGSHEPRAAPAPGGTAGPGTPATIWPRAEQLMAACEAAPTEPAIPAWRGGSFASDLALYTAHPDDESMYAGGTLARASARGKKVAVVIASHGEGGRLLEPLPDAGYVERRDFPLEHVVRVRDEETRVALAALGAERVYLHPGNAQLDYAFTTSCSEAMATWERTVPGGLAGILARLVADLRQRRPRVVITEDRRDDPGGSRHGHHRALGALAELAARHAATTTAPELGGPHVVEELLVMAPKDVPPTVTVTVEPEARRRAVRAYTSQFKPEDIAGFGSRPTEQFLVVWRARGAPAPSGGSRLEALIAP